MKPVLIFVALAGLGLSGCSLLTGGNEGNPYNDAYAGSPDSVYDAKANPPQIIGTVSYDPMAPLPDSGKAAHTDTGINAQMGR